MEKTCTLPSWGFAKLFNYPAVENYTMPLNIAYTHLPIQLNSGIYTNATQKQLAHTFARRLVQMQLTCSACMESINDGDWFPLCSSVVPTTDCFKWCVAKWFQILEFFLPYCQLCASNLFFEVLQNEYFIYSPASCFLHICKSFSTQY